MKMRRTWALRVQNRDENQKMSRGRVVCPKLLAVCAGVAAAGGIVALQITRNTRYPFGSRQRRAVRDAAR